MSDYVWFYSETHTHTLDKANHLFSPHTDIKILQMLSVKCTAAICTVRKSYRKYCDIVCSKTYLLLLDMITSTLAEVCHILQADKWVVAWHFFFLYLWELVMNSQCALVFKSPHASDKKMYCIIKMSFLSLLSSCLPLCAPPDTHTTHKEHKSRLQWKTGV